MSYVALYREWRPQSFEQVVGQTHVTRTLLNALQQGRVSHAYLFCGPRGTGKTSVAKILAKAVNCKQAAAGEPCNACANCQAITEGSSMDVLEIDAASNRGIDEIRELRERVQYAPSGGLFRVYIIDEVHMLTTEAFNALLKTLEEPPRHVIFVLATTEAHKVPATILSRCQRFDFRRITPGELTDRLRLVATQQGIEISEEALLALVRAAEGGLRDALNLLDQCIGFATDEITLEAVNQVLGTVSQAFFLQTVEGLIAKDATRLMFLVEEVVNQGKDVRHYARDLIGYLRDLLIIKLGDKAGQIITVSDALHAQMGQQAEHWDKAVIIELINYFTRAEVDMRWAVQPRWVLEAALIGVETHLQTQAWDQQINALERRLAVLEQEEAPKAKASKIAKDAKGAKAPTPPVPPPVKAEALETKSPLRPPGDEGLDLARVQGQWKTIMEAMRKKSVALQALLLEAEPVGLQGNDLTLAFKKGCNFHRDKADEPANKAVLEEVLARVLKQALEVRCVMQVTMDNPQPNPESKTAAPETPQADPLVQGAVEIFGAERVIIRNEPEN